MATPDTSVFVFVNVPSSFSCLSHVYLFLPCAMLHGPLRGPSTHPDPPDAAFIVRIVLLRAMLSRTPGQRLLQGFNVENLEDLI